MRKYLFAALLLAPAKLCAIKTATPAKIYHLLLVDTPLTVIPEDFLFTALIPKPVNPALQ